MINLKFVSDDSIATHLIQYNFIPIDLQLIEELYEYRGTSVSECISTPNYLNEFIEDLSQMSVDDFENNKNTTLSELHDNFRDNLTVEHYPMWNTMWHDQYNITDELSDDELWDKFKIGVMRLDDFKNRVLFIVGCGYDFFDNHWIPLFKYLFPELFKNNENDMQ